METARTKTGDGQEKPAGDHKRVAQLSRKTSSSSFRLRSPSLNTLRLRRVFDLFDKNGDDLITVDEISQALVILGLDADPKELNAITTSFIRPGNKGLTFEDFEALHKSLNDTFFDCYDDNTFEDEYEDEDDGDGDGDSDDAEKQQVESDLAEAFKVFDENGDGFISAKELQGVLSKLGLPEAQQELPQIERMISSVDQNHDGRVDFFEFKHMMLHTLLAPSS